MAIYLTLFVEDDLSAAVARKMLDQSNGNYKVLGTYLWNKSKIMDRVNGLNKSAQGGVFFVLTDQDTQSRCPPKALSELSAPLHQNLLYRFAVMEIEAWLLADRAAIAQFLSVSANKVSQHPETIDKPKEYLISLARNSKSREIRSDIAPASDSSNRKGPNYTGKLIQFVEECWDIGVARNSSKSLQRTFSKLQSFKPSKSIRR